MKQLSVILFLFVTTFSIAQDSILSTSKFEEFYSKTGTMYKRESLELGKIRAIMISAVRITNLETNDFAEAIQISQSTLNNSGVITIDKEEISGINKAFVFYFEQIKKGKPKIATSYFYYTNNNVAISATYTPNMNNVWSISIYKRYKYINATVDGSEIFFRGKEIDDFIEMFRMADTFKLYK